MFHRLAAGMIAGFFMLLTGCAAVDKAAEHTDASRLAVKAGTMRYIEAEDDRAERAADVQAFIERARGKVDSAAEATVSELAERIRAEIAWNHMAPSEKLLADEVIRAITHSLQERVGDGPLTEEDKLRVRAVLDWSYEAAGLYQEP